MVHIFSFCEFCDMRKQNGCMVWCYHNIMSILYRTQKNHFYNLQEIMIIAAQFLGHLKHSWNLNWPFDLWLGFWLGLPFDLSGLWLQEFQVVPEKMHLIIMQLQFHQLHFIQYVKLQQNQSVVQSKDKSSRSLRYFASICVTYIWW